MVKLQVYQNVQNLNKKRVEYKETVLFKDCRVLDLTQINLSLDIDLLLLLLKR